MTMRGSLVFLVIASVSTTEGNWRKLKSYLPTVLGCDLGKLRWEQVSPAKMIEPHPVWPDVGTRADIKLQLTLPNGRIITEIGTGTFWGGSTVVRGKKISAIEGTQSMHLSHEGKHLRVRGDGYEASPGFFIQ